MKKFLLKFFSFTSVCLIVYCKPLYSLWLVLILFYEYLWFVNFIINIYNNYTKYYIIEVEEIDISAKNSFEIWIEYCKLQAFKRLYILLMKNKKLNTLNVFKTFFIIIFSIPFKLLTLAYFFLVKKNNEKFRTNLNTLYVNSYNKLKYCKIEVLNKKIYLNCFTVGKLCNNLLKRNSLINEENFLYGIRALKTQSKEFEKFEIENIELNLISAKDKNNDLIYWPHYGWKEGTTTLHGTSKLPSYLHVTQLNDVPIPDLVKFGAKNPATIITKDVTKVFTLNKLKFVKKQDLESIKYNHPELFKQSKEDYTYINYKHKIYENILYEFFKLEKNINSSLVNELRTNNYNFILSYANEKDFIEEYNDFYKNKEI